MISHLLKQHPRSALYPFDLVRVITVECLIADVDAASVKGIRIVVFALQVDVVEHIDRFVSRPKANFLQRAKLHFSRSLISHLLFQQRGPVVKPNSQVCVEGAQGALADFDRTNVQRVCLLEFSLPSSRIRRKRLPPVSPSHTFSKSRVDRLYEEFGRTCFSSDLALS